MYRGGDVILLVELESLHMRWAEIRAVPPLDAMEALTVLDLDYNPIESLPSFANARELSRVSLSYTYVSTMTPLHDAPSLLDVELDETLVPEAEVAEFRHDDLRWRSSIVWPRGKRSRARSWRVRQE
jgi:hypothetical protein